LRARALTGTDSASSIFWAPDSHRLAFGQRGKLRSIDVMSGATQSVTDVVNTLLGGTWNRTGEMLFSMGAASNVGLYEVSESGGTPKPVVLPDRAQSLTSLMWPAFLPDGRHFLYLAWSSETTKRGI